MLSFFAPCALLVLNGHPLANCYFLVDDSDESKYVGLLHEGGLSGSVARLKYVFATQTIPGPHSLR